MRSLCLLAVALLLAPFAVRAQSPSPTPNPAPGRVAAWRATLPGGSFVVAVNAMVSVSMHEYVVNGAARVTEVNVDTTGNALARFYYLEPITPRTPLAAGQSVVDKMQDLAREAAGRVDQEAIWQKVMKSNPGSTHAHTVEFRVASKDDLQKIFNSADQAMRQARDTVFNLQ